MNTRRLILAYHRVLPNPDDPLAVSLQQFRDQLTYLQDQGWMSVTLQGIASPELWSSFGGRSLVAITFDDGYLDNYLFAAPILKELGFHATFFVVTGYVGTSKIFPWMSKSSTSLSKINLPMGWEEVRQLRDEGFEVGSHTVTHSLLTQVTAKEALKELDDSRRTLQEQLEVPIMSICYPAGNYNQQIVRMARQVGYQLGVVTPCWAGVKETRLTLRRVGVYGSNSFRIFQLKVSPIFPLVRELMLMLGPRQRGLLPATKRFKWLARATKDVED